MFKIFLAIFLFCFTISCDKSKDDPLILPPDYSEIPDLNNPEKQPKGVNIEEVNKLKSLLLKNEE
ncbi:hypothetical protein LBMAG18_00250 [Alphaproteobacteria bacterium]|nr:hypothetical protein LBMAG18_00250 [Alphaproteobacteria bacterium]